MSTIGALVTEHIAVSAVENHQLVGTIRRFPLDADVTDTLESMHAEEIVQRIAEEIERAGEGRLIEAIGVGFPGINRNGLIEGSPNLKHTKGLNLRDALIQLLNQKNITAAVYIMNDADALAAGIAATSGQLDKLIRVWFLGVGVGLGRYPDIAG